jgi:hypothetical protein
MDFPSHGKYFLSHFFDRLNAKLIDQFSLWLKAKGLSEKTIEEHCANIAFYVNEFLLHEDAVTAEEGALSVGKFLGYWFMRKAT